jgi:glycosyltransferase involved in cell wall biosynthesis
VSTLVTETGSFRVGSPRSMKVLHVVGSGQRRGAELFASDLVRALNVRGVDQCVGVLHANGSVRVPFDCPVVPLGRGGWTLPGLRIHVDALGSTAKVVRTWRPDIVTAHGGEPLKYALFGAGVRSVPIVYRRIGAVLPWMPRVSRRAAHGLMVRKASRVVAVGETVRRETIAMFHASPSRVVSIPNAVDAGRLRATGTREAMRAVLGISETAPVIVSVGAMTWEKDPLGHLDIVCRVARAFPDLVYLVAGDGPLRVAAEAAARTLGLLDNVRFLGSRSDVGDLLAASDVLLLATRTEGMPGCVIEAGMAGVPVVAYAVGGVPEIVADGVTGFLGPPEQAEALANALEQVLSDADYRARLGSSARDHCLERFDIGPVAARWISLYEEVLESR